MGFSMPSFFSSWEIILCVNPQSECLDPIDSRFDDDPMEDLWDPLDPRFDDPMEVLWDPLDLRFEPFLEDNPLIASPSLDPMELRFGVLHGTGPVDDPLFEFRFEDPRVAIVVFGLWILFSIDLFSFLNSTKDPAVRIFVPDEPYWAIKDKKKKVAQWNYLLSARWRIFWLTVWRMSQFNI